MALIKCPKCGCQNAISFSKCTKCNALLIYNVEKPVISNPAINKPATNRKHNAKKPKQTKFFNIDSVVLSILIIGSVILYILSKYDWKWAFLHLVWLLGLIIYSIIIICKKVKQKKKAPQSTKTHTITNNTTEDKRPTARYYISFPHRYDEYVLSYEYHRIPYALLGAYNHTGEAQIEVDYKSHTVYILVNMLRYGILTHEHKRDMVIDFMIRNEPVAVAVEDDKTVCLGFYKKLSDILSKSKTTCRLSNLSKYGYIGFASVGDYVTFDRDFDSEKYTALLNGTELGDVSPSISEQIEDSSFKAFGRIIEIGENKNGNDYCKIEIYFG